MANRVIGRFRLISIAVAAVIAVLTQQQYAQAFKVPVNGPFAYEVKTTAGTSDLYKYGFNYLTPAKLQIEGTASNFGYPAWSHDGQRLAFSWKGDIYSAEVSGIYLINPAQVSFNADSDIEPAWSPDGMTIAYASKTGGQDWELWRASAQGDKASQVQLTDNSAQDSSPTFSPDSSKIAFSSDLWETPFCKANTLDIYIVNALNGGSRKWVYRDCSEDRNPDWSPKGDRIVFDSVDMDKPQIYMADVNSGSVELVTGGEENKGFFNYEPVWSPLADQIGFLSFRSGQTDIYTVGPDGSGTKKLTNSSTAERALDWGKTYKDAGEISPVETPPNSQEDVVAPGPDEKYEPQPFEPDPPPPVDAQDYQAPKVKINKRSLRKFIRSLGKRRRPRFIKGTATDDRDVTQVWASVVLQKGSNCYSLKGKRARKVVCDKVGMSKAMLRGGKSWRFALNLPRRKLERLKPRGLKHGPASARIYVFAIAVDGGGNLSDTTTLSLPLK